MKSQPQNPELRNNPENFQHGCFGVFIGVFFFFFFFWGGGCLFLCVCVCVLFERVQMNGDTHYSFNGFIC